ncbi:hypothetical protein [Leptospira noguchii]|uniref:Uncharacterized protein n=1 Tax=Leptospira noguchii str. 2001034031 TaxID=1193053 RepID=M6YBG7_9LEPT|nr:hypothetical protein [Leptospira noguchii]EMO91105.1 hypothetical protein LEP1GSC024_2409 [Leptospira noguchii str. 2001034031]
MLSLKKISFLNEYGVKGATTNPDFTDKFLKVGTTSKFGCDYDQTLYGRMHLKQKRGNSYF